MLDRCAARSSSTETCIPSCWRAHADALLDPEGVRGPHRRDPAQRGAELGGARPGCPGRPASATSRASPRRRMSSASGTSRTWRATTGHARIDDAFARVDVDRRAPAPLLRQRRRAPARRLPAGGRRRSRASFDRVPDRRRDARSRRPRAISASDGAASAALRAPRARRRDARAARPRSTTSSSRPASSTRCRRSSSDARASTTGSSGERGSAAPVVDATRAVVAVHQRHDYAHVTGGFEEAHFGGEARRNEELAGGERRIYTIYDASHRLQPAASSAGTRARRSGCARARARPPGSSRS